MRKIDLQKDRQFYNTECKAPSEYTDDLLDLYRFNLMLKLYKAISPENRLFKNRTVLDVVCGYGREAYLILDQEPKFLVLGDYSLQQIKQAKKYLEKFSEKYILCADSENLPFKDKSFDICFITEALHHFVHTQKGLEELIRVAGDAVLIDEPKDGLIRGLLNQLFIFLNIKEEYERGYLEAFRINKPMLKEFCIKYKLDMVFFPYFIYYFQWYKRTKNKFIKALYRNILIILNVFLHFFGNRAIVIMRKSRLGDRYALER